MFRPARISSSRSWLSTPSGSPTDPQAELTPRLQALCTSSALVRERPHARSFVHAQTRQRATVRRGCCQRCCQQPFCRRLVRTPVGGMRTEVGGCCRLVAAGVGEQVRVAVGRRPALIPIRTPAAFSLPRCCPTPRSQAGHQPMSRLTSALATATSSSAAWGTSVSSRRVKRSIKACL